MPSAEQLNVLDTKTSSDVGSVFQGGYLSNSPPELETDPQKIRELNARIAQLSAFMELNDMSSILQSKNDCMIVIKASLKSEQNLAECYNVTEKSYTELIDAIVESPTLGNIRTLEHVVRSSYFYEIRSMYPDFHKSYLACDLLSAFAKKPNFDINEPLKDGVTLLDCAENGQQGYYELRSKDLIAALKKHGAKNMRELRTVTHPSFNSNVDDQGAPIDNNKTTEQAQTNSLWNNLAKFVDNANRLFDSNFNRNSYTPKIYNDQRVTNYQWLAIVAFIRLLILPLLSTVYVVSRLTLIVLNPQAYKHNPVKASLMLGASLLTVGTVIGLTLGTSLFSAQTMIYIAGSVGGGAFVVGLVGIVAFATFLHLAKSLAQALNTQKLVDTSISDEVAYVTAPKHHIQKNSVLEQPFEKHHKALVMDYYINIKLPPIMPPRQSEKLKPVLFKFESIAQAKRNKADISEMVNELKYALNSVSQDLPNNKSITSAKNAANKGAFKMGM